MLNNSTLYKLIIDTTNEGVWMIDEFNKTNFVNNKMIDVLGYSEDEMLGKNLFDFMDNDGIELAKKNLERNANGISELHEFKFKNKNGDDVWTQLNTSPIIINGVNKGSLAMVTDITARKAKEIEESEIHRNYRSLFEDCPVPIWDEDFSEVKCRIDALRRKGIIDFKKHFENNLGDLVYCAQGLVINDVNKAVVELNEAKDKAHVLRSYAELATRETLRYTIDQLVAISENKTTYQHEVKLKTFGGNYRHVLMKWTVVKGYEKTYKKVYLTTIDFTDRIIEENQFLKNTNKEKETLLKEIHHRVKNNLQIIMSLLNLQSRSIDDLETKDLFNVSIGRIQSMSIVHQLLYQAENFSKIEFRDYLERLVYPLISSIKGDGCQIEFKIDVENVVLNINTSIPLGLIITELITNSLKHGIKQCTGEISISMRNTENNKYLLEIGDNGDNFPSDFDINKTETLGLQLVTSLVEQLSGTISRDNSKSGTHYKITFEEVEDNSMKK
ncbi:MAG TPA: PAS domain S-box protein [Crocinitomicaceae bacterium]|nr:PAS domain S-box protein [Crocinitomicaceae bacterium]